MKNKSPKKVFDTIWASHGGAFEEGRSPPRKVGRERERGWMIINWGKGEEEEEEGETPAATP